MVPPLADTGGGGLIFAYEIVYATVKNTEEKEGKEDHDEEVPNENVVPNITHVFPHLGWTH